MGIIFTEVNEENWEECIGLKVLKAQEDFVAPNWYSILESKFKKDIYPMCIYDDEVMVGFIMYCLDPDTNRMEMCRLMIDHKFQGKGFGGAAVQKLLGMIREKYGKIKFFTSIEPDNTSAQRLYEDLGFQKTGEKMWDEEVMSIQL